MEKITLESFKKSPPLSFLYGGKPFPEGFNLIEEGAGGSLLYEHGETKLLFRVDVKMFEDTGAAEWTGWFENAGEKDSAQINNVNILDTALDCPAGKSVASASRGTNGGEKGIGINGFEYFKQELASGDNAVYKSNGSAIFMPFAYANTGQGGAFVGLGWTGDWFINVAQSDKAINITAGMQKADFFLHPGERVRTPLVLLLPWEGPETGGHNQLRRHMVCHHLPKGSDGQPQTPVCLGTWGGMKTHNHLKLIEFVKEHGLKFDCYWMDAGWFGPDHDAEEFQNFHTEDWLYNVGEWRVNRAIHPDGLMPISNAAHEAGMKFLLWCAPFICVYDKGWYLNHPEWGRLEKPGPIGLNPKETQLVSMYVDDPDAVAFISEQIGSVMRDSGVDYYREDCSFPIGRPDAEGRIGIGEMNAVENFYRLWDRLLELNPGMIIDNCCGGGNRLDLETMSRSYCFWRSDYNCDHNADPLANQSMTYGLNHWVPLVSGTVLPKERTYAFRSGISGAMSFGLFKTGGFGDGETEPKADFNVEWHREMLSQYQQVKMFLWGDFYPLTGCDINTDSFIAYEFFRPDLDSGIILAFRRQDCETEKLVVTPALEAGAKYELRDIDSGNITVIDGGAEYEISITDKPGSALVLIAGPCAKA